MKTTKMSLANIQGKLSRLEMKNVTGGVASYQTVCTCVGSDLETTVCTGNVITCGYLALKYCKSIGFGGIDCVSEPKP